MVISDDDALTEIRTTRICFTNPEFLQALAAEAPVPTDYLEFNQYTERVDAGLYYIGWNIEKYFVGPKNTNMMFVCSDAYTQAIDGRCESRDTIMWRAAKMWAINFSNIYITITHAVMYGSKITKQQQEFLALYREFFTP